MIVHSGSNRRYFAQSVHSGEKMRGSGRDESSKSFGIEDPGLGTQLRTRDPTSTEGGTPQKLGRYFVDSKAVGGRGRDRTGDPLLAKQVLSQLSYTPTREAVLILKHFPTFLPLHFMVSTLDRARTVHLSPHCTRTVLTRRPHPDQKVDIAMPSVQDLAGKKSGTVAGSTPGIRRFGSIGMGVRP